MPAPAKTREAILAVLEKHGELHVAKIAELMDRNRRTIFGIVRDTHLKGLIHISGYHRNIGSHGRWGAIYALGAGQDAKPPRVDSEKQAKKRYAQKYGEVIRLRTQKRRGKTMHPWLVLLGA